MILAGDLGGTKCNLALFDGDVATREQSYKCAEFASLEDILKAFAPGKVGAACIAVAGVVAGQTAKITNLPWTIDADAIGKHLGCHVALLNDLQATALGALHLPDDKLAVLQAGKPVEHGTIAVIAPGTGLGEATLLHDGARYRALPSEGGHADFAPTTDDELALLVFLRKRYKGHVSNERVLCGKGVGDLYDYLGGKGTFDGDRNAAITQVGLANEDPIAARALVMFAEALGAEAGNMALRAMATGGVIIGGGIPPKLLPALQTGALIARFRDKGRFADWMSNLPVRVSLEPRAALLGAAHHAANDEAT